MTEDQAAKESRCGFVALIGAPNSGKSTLINVLVGAKVAIVTQKAQTTRGPVLGIAIDGQSQIILVDTPGIFQPKRRLDRAMSAAAWSRAGDADLVALVIDSERAHTARGLDAWLDPVFETLPTVKRPIIAVLNKIDLVARPELLVLAEELGKRHDFERTFMISALNGDGVPDLKSYLVEAVPPGPWLYPEDQLTDAPIRQAAAEITREKLFLRLHDELPYSLTVETAEWKELKDGSVRIEQTIYVMRESQRKILLGAKGATIKEISMAARKEIGEMVGAAVHLFLFVKVRERWGEDPERYREMGLDYPKE
ncbi:MAG TPA: GTPase Era [Methyloceanibacter sp.]|nr:GTPase Era [Methyloceanibacter sp.]